MLECTCALRLCGVCSTALVSQEKTSCLKFQYSARMKQTKLGLDEKP